MNIINTTLCSSLNLLNFVCVWTLHHFTAKNFFFHFVQVCYKKCAIFTFRLTKINKCCCIYTNVFPPNCKLQFLNQFRSSFNSTFRNGYSFLISQSNPWTSNFVKALGFVSNIARVAVKPLIRIQNFSSATHAGSFYCYFRLH